MHFKIRELPVTLQGDSGLSKIIVQLKPMLRAIKQGWQGLLLEICSMAIGIQASSEEHKEVAVGIDELL